MIFENDYGSIGSYESHVAVRYCLRDVKNIVNQLAEEYKGGWIEKLLEAKKNCGEDSDCSECPFGQIEDRCILNELQIESDNNGWIPCSEDKPKKNGWYECWYMTSAVGENKYYEPITLYWEDNIWLYRPNKFNMPTQSNVVAWKPITPYQPKGE